MSVPLSSTPVPRRALHTGVAGGVGGVKVLPRRRGAGREATWSQSLATGLPCTQLLAFRLPRLAFFPALGALPKARTACGPVVLPIAHLPDWSLCFRFALSEGQALGRAPKKNICF